MHRLLAPIVTALIVLPAVAAAEGLPIRPGAWRIASSVAVSIAPRPRDQESSQCISRDTINADELTGRSNLCDNEDVEIAGDTMTWKIRCREQMAGNEGEARLTVRGDVLEGEMKLRSPPRTGSQRIIVTTTWRGTRTGECE